MHTTRAESKTRNSQCAICGGDLPERKGRRGRPSRYCGEACKRAGAAQRKAERRQAERAAESTARAEKTKDWVIRLRALVLAVSRGEEHAATPDTYDWQVNVRPGLSALEARLYRRVWRRAASLDDVRMSERGCPAPVEVDRLWAAAVEVAEHIMGGGPGEGLPLNVRTHPELIAHGDRPPSRFMAQGEADGFPTAGGPLDTPTTYGEGEGYYLSYPNALWDAQTVDEWRQNGRRERRPGKPRVRLADRSDLI